MKTNLALLAALLVAAVSCSRVNPEDGNSESGLIPVTFNAQTEEVEVLSKASLQSNLAMHWNNGDRIKVFDGVSDALPPFLTTDEGPLASFSGSVSTKEGPFYALYPYQSDARMENGTIYATLPNIQYAVAGGIPSNAYIAVAKANSINEPLEFQCLTAFYKFTLNDSNAGNIESITFSGNYGDAISGGLKITFDENGIATDSFNDVFYTVTLVGQFEDGKDYMFAVREQYFEDGITISILYKDGTHRYISSQASPTVGGSRVPKQQNLILNIGALTASQMSTDTPEDNFTAYIHYYDLEVAGETYNKTEYGRATLLKSGSETIMNGNNIKDFGMFFIDSQSTGISVKSNTVRTISGNVGIIGRWPDKENLYQPTVYMKFDTGKIIMKDLTIDLSNQVNQSYYILNQSSNDMECLHIDNCKFKSVWCRIYHQDGQAMQGGLKSLRVVNSDFQIANHDSWTIQLFNFSSSTVLHACREIIFDNNLIYNPGTFRATDIIYTIDNTAQTGRTWVTTASYCNNTFYNCASVNCQFRWYQVESLKMNRNILWAPTDLAVNNFMILLRSEEQSSKNIEVNENIAYGLATANYWKLTHDNSTYKITEGNTLTKLASDPLATKDTENGIFTPVAAYKAYGAQR